MTGRQMFKILAITSASVALLFCSSSAFAQKFDANGRCHAANGQFAKAEVCGGASGKMARAAPSATAAAAPASATVGQATRCRDALGHFASCNAAQSANTAAKNATAAAKNSTVAAIAPAPSASARCKDAKGRFMKCGAAASATSAAKNATAVAGKTASAARCKTDKGRFAKCGTAGAHPA